MNAQCLSLKYFPFFVSGDTDTNLVILSQTNNENGLEKMTQYPSKYFRSSQATNNVLTK